MQKLAKREEQIMQILWEHGPAFGKEIIEHFPAPKPHYNTVSTIIRILEKKQFVDHKSFGNSHQFYALISKDTYQKEALGDVLDKYFDNSYRKMVTYFAKEEKISTDDLEEIINMIKNKKA
ncbi:MAG: BlaI/MecI/CopY family transcriptional regulator [Saprospiraceae bacterium]|nr:BlaI/MecI/CopY family transcriptional regulator [Saprospiraceae bacterium]